MEEKEVFKQNLEETDTQGMLFPMQLLMKEYVKMPDEKKITEVLNKHLGNVKCISYKEEMAGFSANKYTAEFKQGKMPPQLFIMGCKEFDGSKIDEFKKSQMWDCANDKDRILSECKYSITATDMMAATLPYKERAELYMDFMEALVELFPECEAVYFLNTGKMFLANDIRKHTIAREARYIMFGVNVRFFNIEGTNDMIVDTVGMSTLFLPDIQYHFHDMDPNCLVNHAYNIALYIFNNNNPIKDGDTVDAIIDGLISKEIQWKCQYEMSLIQPSRELIDINMNEYAAGQR
ncbi:MAG: DUF4261 domain-containing protein [Clostridium sp.]|nr:DUF4261 domain-containing protein [Clostridium sp.]